MALWTNAGRNLVATGVQSAGVNAAIAYVGISGGCGTVAANIASGVAITSITLDANVPLNLSSAQSLTITDGSNTETVTTSGPVTGATTTVIPINSWTPVHSYLAHVTGVCPTPLATDIALYNESVRVACNIGAAGAGAGESLNAAYYDGTQATAVYLLVGFFGGSTASGSVATGTLMGEDVQFWNHTINNDSNMYQADSTV